MANRFCFSGFSFFDGIQLVSSSRQQRTLAAPVVLNGFGYWTGEDIRVEFRPAKSNSGYVFIREDVIPARRIAAVPENRVITPRRTTLTQGGATVEMVEHLLAALAGMQIDNCEIAVSSREMPAFDGSCQDAVEALATVGAVEQSHVRPILELDETIRVGDDESWVEARPRDGGMSLRYELDYGAGPIGSQSFAVDLTPEVFRNEIAPARTFLLQSEAERLLEQGISNRASFSDLLVFGDEGLIKNQLRFDDECARHKALDVVGDLALIGFDLSAEVVAHRSGHRHNTELAALLLSRYKSPHKSRLSA